MRAFTHSLKIASSALQMANYRCCSNTKSFGSIVTLAGSVDEFDEFFESIGRDITDMNKGLTFSRMLRQSKFVQLGDFGARLVTGRVSQRVQDDLYIDFGLKFNAVCRAPTNSEAYREGAVVLLRLHDPELSERFLGSGHDLTLLEADATLIRLLRPGSSRGALIIFMLPLPLLWKHRKLKLLKSTKQEWKWENASQGNHEIDAVKAGRN